MNKPTVVLSFDVEREFGFIEAMGHPTRLAILKRPDNYDTHLRIMIDKLDKYEVPATLAIVGMLFKVTGTILDLVEKAKYQHDIGLHGHMHWKYGTMLPNQAAEDISLGVSVLKEFDISPVSFVFPSDSIGYLELLQERGIKVFRGKTPSVGHPMLNRLVSNICKPKKQMGMVCLPGSLFYHGSKYAKLNLWVAKRGVDNVIKKGGVYHVWVHPHNLLLGYNHLEYFEKFLHYIALRRNRGELEIKTMRDFG